MLLYLQFYVRYDNMSMKGGLLNHFTALRYFPDFHSCQNTGYLPIIVFISGRSSVAVTLVKYDDD